MKEPCTALPIRAYTEYIVFEQEPTYGRKTQIVFHLTLKMRWTFHSQFRL